MSIYEIYQNVIATGSYKLADMEERIETIYAQGKITAEERVALLQLADDSAKDAYQIDISAKLAELEHRLAIIESAGIAVLESAGIVPWEAGMSTAKGQTVLYDILKEGFMRFLRYDGGRASTSLSPGKIDGWVVLASAGGAVTHTVEKDADGNIILVPVNEETAGE